MGEKKLITKPNPTFFWQGLLLVLPLLVLSAVGLVALRQDKKLAQQEASERAQSIADQLLPVLWNELVDTNITSASGNVFELNENGDLIYPPPVQSTPAPQPLDTERLSTLQKQLWSRARQLECETGDQTSAMQSYREFLDSKPPNNFIAQAEYSLGVLLTKQTQPGDAARHFAMVAREFRGARSEAGLPLALLAELKLIELGSSTNLLDGNRPISMFCSNAVNEPTLLTPLLLETVRQHAATSDDQNELEKWQQIWTKHEMGRSLHQATFAALHSTEPPQGPVFWLDYSPDDLPTRQMRTNIAAAESRWLIVANEKNRITESPWRIPNLRKSSLKNVFLLGPVLSGPLESEWPKDYRLFQCFGEKDLANRFDIAIQRSVQIPDYLGIGLQIAGQGLKPPSKGLRQWREVAYAGKGENVRGQHRDKPPTNILASAAQMKLGVEALRINLFLVNPSALFKYQSARTFWFGSLITVSFIGALVGLFAAGRAFHRQLQLNSLKSNFVSSVSHELRAPIASVRLLAESLERGKISEPQKQNEYFRFIGQECRRLSSLIENVLDFSRIEQGRKQYEFEPTDVTALVTQTCQLMEPYAAEKQVTLELKLPALEASPGPQPLLDGRAVQQALVNLIDNAIKHSPKNQKVTIGFAFSQQNSAQPSDTTDYLVLWVEDEGPGIPAEEHEKIFERFYRLGSELRRETAGVGIGLSIVKHIVEAHSGKIVVRSAPGEGSRFTIHLPCRAS
jgi:signal transduction histidine kinase